MVLTRKMLLRTKGAAVQEGLDVATGRLARGSGETATCWTMEQCVWLDRAAREFYATHCGTRHPDIHGAQYGWCCRVATHLPLPEVLQLAHVEIHNTLQFARDLGRAGPDVPLGDGPEKKFTWRNWEEMDAVQRSYAKGTYQESVDPQGVVRLPILRNHVPISALPDGLQSARLKAQTFATNIDGRAVSPHHSCNVHRHISNPVADRRPARVHTVPRRAHSLPRSVPGRKSAHEGHEMVREHDRLPDGASVRLAAGA